MGGGGGQKSVTSNNPTPIFNPWPNTNRAGKLPSGLQPVGLYYPFQINSTTQDLVG